MFFSAFLTRHFPFLCGIAYHVLPCPVLSFLMSLSFAYMPCLSFQTFSFPFAVTPFFYVLPFDLFIALRFAFVSSPVFPFLFFCILTMSFPVLSPSTLYFPSILARFFFPRALFFLFLSHPFPSLCYVSVLARPVPFGPFAVFLH